MSDFQTFELHDLYERVVIDFPLADLPAHVEAFGFNLDATCRESADLDGGDAAPVEQGFLLRGAVRW